MYVTSKGADLLIFPDWAQMLVNVLVLNAFVCSCVCRRNVQSTNKVCS